MVLVFSQSTSSKSMPAAPFRTPCARSSPPTPSWCCYRRGRPTGGGASQREPPLAGSRCARALWWPAAASQAPQAPHPPSLQPQNV